MKFIIDRHQTSDIRHQTSDIRHQTSDIRHQTSDIRHQTSINKYADIFLPAYFIIYCF
ncbi:hypothetical protein [uncultured Brachyspira sp.]|uniref:hypothetical protein n=1 Tax=uncultured Brachyspira sp. TaxID=221953 RepID=UPI00261ECB34|nr:hypothetical protein [uncultured Brachyspira sp.]